MKKSKRGQGKPKKSARSAELPPRGDEKRFVLEKLLGYGGMCEVYEALDLQRLSWNDRSPRVALKRLLPKFVGNNQAKLALAQEYFTLRNLSHEGVVRAYDLHEEEWGLCYSMEILEGATLYQKQVRMHGGFGRQGIDIADKVFASLAYLHGHGIIHGDMKPANIFLAAQNRVVLFDFSVSQMEARPGRASSGITQGLRNILKIQAYSARHASPERIASGEPSLADDIFSACCTLFECIEGAHPFNNRTAQEAMEQRIAPAGPVVLSKRQWRALIQGLSFDPDKRPDAVWLRSAFSSGSGLFTRLLSPF